MPTANELLLDELLRRSVYLQRFGRSLGNELIKMLDATEPELRSIIESRLARVVSRGFRFEDAASSRLKLLQEALDAVRGPVWGEGSAMLMNNMRGLVRLEQEYLAQALRTLAPGAINPVMQPYTQLASMVFSRPFQGRTLKDWASAMEEDDLKRIMDSIRIGLARGDDIGGITRRVLGSVEFDGADGATGGSRRAVASVVRTAVNHIANDARRLFAEANLDIIKGEVYVAVLDSKTTAICRSLDGKVYPFGKGPLPPLHWNCRSALVPLMEGEAPPRTTYQTWLRRQPAAFQDEVLGDAKGALFRRGGLTLDKFVDKFGDEFTLDDLRDKFPTAFRKANV